MKFNFLCFFYLYEKAFLKKNVFFFNFNFFKVLEFKKLDEYYNNFPAFFFGVRKDFLIPFYFGFRHIIDLFSFFFLSIYSSFVCNFFYFNFLSLIFPEKRHINYFVIQIL